MRNTLFRKSLVTAIIILFVGTNIIPSLEGIWIKKEFSSGLNPPYGSNNDRAILNVGGIGAGNYSKIQDAIDNASYGDTVFIYDDSSPYYENLVITLDNIRIYGEDRNTTTIDGNNNGDVVLISNTDFVYIKELTITGSGGNPQDAGIELFNSENCYIENNNFIDQPVGIYFNGSPYNNIKKNIFSSNYLRSVYLVYSTGNHFENNIFTNSDTGVFLFSSNYSIIENNDFLNNIIGIDATYSKGNTINDNDFLNYSIGVNVSEFNTGFTITFNDFINGAYGVFILSTNQITVNDNNCSDNDYGIYVYSSDDLDLLGNDCSDNIIGIYTYNCNISVIWNNICSNNSDTGLSLSSSSNNLIGLNNFLNNSIGVNISGNSIDNTITDNVCMNNVQGFFISAVNKNTITDNDCLDNEYGIYVDSAINQSIDGNDCSNNNIGIYIFNSNNNDFNNNICSNNSDTGLSLSSSSVNLIGYNDCLNNSVGINVSGVNDNNTITFNVCINNVHGIYISATNENTIIDNNCSDNTYGIYIDSSTNQNIDGNDCLSNNIGIYMDSSNNNVVGNNTCSNNNEDGINLSNFCYNNTITGNIIFSNYGFGIYLNSSSNNIIYDNYFNNINNAFDDENNTWNITKTPGINIHGGAYLGGNYWNDYTGSDLTEDGLGDTYLPYNSNGTIQNDGDWLPLINAPPYEPKNPNPADGATNIHVTDDLSWTGGDPGPGDIVTYDVYFGTTNPPTVKVSANQSGTTYDPGQMNLTTTYYWQIVAWDHHGESTNGSIWSFTTSENNPPNAPVINGRKTGKPRNEYSYVFLTQDPDGDDIYYFIFWGDGSFEEWIGPYNSDQVVSVSHNWTVKGTYTIMARARDIHGEISEWTTFKVWMTSSRSKAITNSFFLRFFEIILDKFPLLGYILQMMNLC